MVAADVLIYFGDLSPPFEAAARAVRQGGSARVQHQSSCRKGPFGFLPSGRFSHSASYVRNLADTDFIELRFASKPRSGLEATERVPGQVLCFPAQVSPGALLLFPTPAVSGAPRSGLPAKLFRQPEDDRLSGNRALSYVRNRRGRAHISAGFPDRISPTFKLKFSRTLVSGRCRWHCHATRRGIASVPVRPAAFTRFRASRPIVSSERNRRESRPDRDRHLQPGAIQCFRAGGGGRGRCRSRGGLDQSGRIDRPRRPGIHTCQYTHIESITGLWQSFHARGSGRF